LHLDLLLLEIKENEGDLEDKKETERGKVIQYGMEFEIDAEKQTF